MIAEPCRKIAPVKTYHGFYHTTARAWQTCKHFKRTKRLAFLQMTGTRIK